MKFLILFLFTFMFAWAGEIDFKSEIALLKTIGEKHFDKDVKADLILIDFWASWCEPCKDGFIYYEDKIKTTKSKKIILISVNLDDKVDKAEAFLKTFKHDNVIVWDEKKKFMSLLDFDAIPQLVVLDKDWKPLETISGFNTKAKKKLAKYF
jgi:thiol-disulfide isomerase/thioredoxin